MHEPGKRERDICRGSTLLPPPLSRSLSVSFSLTLLHASALITVHQRSKEYPINQRTALEQLCGMLKQCSSRVCQHWHGVLLPHRLALFTLTKTASF